MINLEQIKLENGILSQSDALKIYKHHLTTLRLDYFKKLSLPCSTKIYTAICNIHNNYNPVDDVNKSITNLVSEQLNKGGKVYFWSDMHFFHSNIIKYSNRPFETVKNMNDILLHNYYKNISSEDVVIIGGDISFAGKERTIDLLKNLPGKKIWVIGNHDIERKSMKLLNFHISDLIAMAFSFNIKDKDNNIKNFIVSHYPIGNQWLPDNTWNIHGHTHQYKMDLKNINISVEATNYSPIELNELLKSHFTLQEDI